MEVVFLGHAERPIYDYACKQQWQDHVRYECPAKLTREELRAVERTCRATFMALGCRDVARVDLRLTPEGRVYVIEVNPLPGLTPDYSDLCLIANGARIGYSTLIGEVLSGAIKRWQGRQRHVERSDDAPREAASSSDVTAAAEAAPIN
jgi:D-alanine-D-alanine ligase